MDVSAWDHLCNSRCVINPRDKPFGAVLPIEVQNRIMWMMWKGEHGDKYKRVTIELLKLPLCALADWCSRPNKQKSFEEDVWCMTCQSFGCVDKPQCHWCDLYANDHESVEQKVVERALQVKRDAISTYDEDSYQRFVRENMQKYVDVHQFTITNVLLPMLVWVRPGENQINHHPIREMDIGFVNIMLGCEMLLNEFMIRNNKTEFRSPRMIAEEHREKMERRRMLKRMKEEYSKAGDGLFIVELNDI